MQQQQSGRVTLSLGTKLLASVLALLFLTISFLTYSAVVLLTDDKRAYTFQTQATEADLIGRILMVNIQKSIESLRQALGSVSPTQPVTEPQKNILQTLIDNQSDLAGISLALLNPTSNEITPITRHSRAETLKKAKLEADELQISSERIKGVKKELLEKSYALINLSKVGKPPLLGVVIADLSLKENPTGIPIAIAYLPLGDLARSIRQSQLTVATDQGVILFDNDAEALYSGKNLSQDPLYEFILRNPLANGTREYETQEGKFLGSYVKPRLDLLVMTKTSWANAITATYKLTQKFVLLGMMTIGAAIIFAIFFARTITSPVNRLFQATREVAAGNFNVSLKRVSSDEIGALTDSFVAMSARISDLLQESMRKVHLENELAIASTVQQTLLPAPKFADEQIQMVSHYQSASECGGDWWGHFRVGDQLCVMIADATGHGLPSALITAAAQSSVSVISKFAQDYPAFALDPGKLLTFANRAIYGASKGAIMMTFFIGVIDFKTKKMKFASAGHNPPWLFRDEAGVIQHKSLVATGSRLGEFPDVPNFEEKEMDLRPGDLLFLYTDGIMEGKNLADEMYGKKRVLKFCKDGFVQSSDALIANMMKDFNHYNEGKPYDDDVTLVAARIL